MTTMINTDNKQINTDRISGNPRSISENHKVKKLIHADITFKVRGAIFRVYNGLGHGHKEQVYQKALEKEFAEMKLSYKKEANLNVKYKGEIVGNYRPDFVIDDKVILEIKAVEFMPKSFIEQLIHYLKTTEFEIGLLVNFGAPRLVIKRLVWTKNRRVSAVNQRQSVFKSASICL